MLPLIVFPGIELWATGTIRAGLEAHPHDFGSVYVSNKRAKQTPAVWIRRDGGPSAKLRDNPRLGVNVFAAEQQVEDFAEFVSALLIASADGQPVTWIQRTSGPSWIADPSGARRYMTFELHSRGQQL